MLKVRSCVARGALSCTPDSTSMISKFLLAAILMACWFASDVMGVVTCDPVTAQAMGFTCPPEDPSVPFDELKPFPGNCSKFISCSNGMPFCMDCVATLEFSPTLKRCEFPENAGCTAESTPADTTTGPVDTTAGPVDTTAAPVDPTAEPATTTEYPYEEDEYYTTKKYEPY